MELNGQLVLGCLEEDNPQRGHFRVRPLLVSTGPLSPEDQAVFRDDGYIRVVPDKNEQRTFKDRMRKLGSLCVMDLRGSPKENGKLRSNKNYAPQKGEKNRYIVYSNAVSALPEDTFFEVVSDTRLQDAATAQAYTRHGGRIHGPVSRDSGESLPEDRPLLPDDARLFSVSMPDGGTRLFYWPATEKAAEVPAEPAPEPQPAVVEQTQSVALTEPKNAIDLIRELNGQMVASMKGEQEGAREAPEAVVISQVGTPLYHAVLPPSQEKSDNHSLARAVEKSRKTQQEQKTAESPEPSLEEAQEPALKEEKASSGKKARSAGKASVKVEKAQAKEKPVKSAPQSAPERDRVLAALQAQVEDIEAERLMTVMNLEKARADEAEYVNQLMQQAEDTWKERESQANERLEALREQIAVLEAERNQLQEALAQQEKDARLPATCLRTVPGEEVSAQLVRDRLCTALQERGFRADAVLAEAVLTAWAVSEDKMLCVVPDTPEDADLFAEAFAAALGAPFGRDADACAGCLESSAVTMNRIFTGTEDLHLTVWTDEALPQNRLYPSFRAEQSGEEPAAVFTAFSPVREQALRAELTGSMSPLNGEASAFLAGVRAVCLEGGSPLPLSCVRMFKRFVMAAQNRMPGGVQKALDCGMMIYVLPALGTNEVREKLLPFCAALPGTRAMLEARA